MGFLSDLFKPTCPDCGDRIRTDGHTREGRLICDACETKARAADAERARQADERRKAEEAAYERMMERRSFGSDPRYDPDR
jgi:tRNA(Ile2) C34 agmatinyltransferase TiaS